MVCCSARHVGIVLTVVLLEGGTLIAEHGRTSVPTVIVRQAAPKQSALLMRLALGSPLRASAECLKINRALYSAAF